MHRPILHRDKRVNLAFAIHDEPQRHRLDASRRKPRAHLLPQDRADAVTDQPVQHAPRLLGVDQVHVDGARMRKRLVDGMLGDLVKDHALRQTRFDLGGFHQVPGDRLALAVGVGGQVNLSVTLRQFFQFLDNFLLLVGDAILRLEVMFDVHRKRRAEQITDVADGGLHRVSLAEEAPHCPGLGGRFHNDQFAVARLLHLRRFFGRSQFRVGVGPAHTVKFRPAHGTRADRHRRTLGIKSRLWLVHLAFGLALHTIGFHIALQILGIKSGKQ